jgi:hypothetical protein
LENRQGYNNTRIHFMSSHIERMLQIVKIVVVTLCAFTIGCSATVTHQPEGSNATGIRYYQNAPYLLIYSDGKGGLRWQILYLPDQSRIMTATPVVLGGHTEMTLYFQNGVLSSSSTLGDTTELPKAAIAAIQSAIAVLSKGIFEGPKVNGFPPPYLYKVIVNGDAITFLGGKGDSSIQVPIKQEQGQ